MTTRLYPFLCALFLLAGCSGGGVGGPAVDAKPGDDHTLDPAAGGQSGVEGQQPGGTPGIPHNPCQSSEETLEAGDTTVFGVSTEALIARLQPTPPLPLHWVAYDELPGTVYSPGPGLSNLSVRVSLREGEIKQYQDASGVPEQCRLRELRVPVLLELESDDGALNERSETELVFDGPARASASTLIQIDDVAGSFALSEVGQRREDELYVPLAMEIELALWPGGSRGQITVAYSVEGPVHPPSAPTAMPPATRTDPAAVVSDGAFAIRVPDHWSQFAVWPRLERCDGPGSRDPVEADAKVIGLSVRDAMDALGTGDWTLSPQGADSAEPVRFRLEAPPGLLCVEARGDELTFDAVATLEVEAQDAGALTGLRAPTQFEIRARTDADATGFEELRFERRGVVYERTREQLHSETGLTLDAGDEYQRMWWSFHGSLGNLGNSGEMATATTMTDLDAGTEDGEGDGCAGELLVTSLNAEQAAEIERTLSQGGPGASISWDDATGWPVLPGDTLLRAALGHCAARVTHDAQP